ncbi:MAG: hypothetical protein AAF614_01050 [Chloroflexota bacterium]
MTAFFLASFSFLVTLLNAICPPPITDMPVLVTWYDPSLGGINCDVDCDTFADSSPVTPEAYGAVTACIPEWLGAELTISGLGTFHCRDTGGSIVVAFNDYYQQWVIHVDVLQTEMPSWNYELRDWQLNWNLNPSTPTNKSSHIPVAYQEATPACALSELNLASPIAHTRQQPSFSVIHYNEPITYVQSCLDGASQQVVTSTLCKT